MMMGPNKRSNLNYTLKLNISVILISLWEPKEIVKRTKSIRFRRKECYFYQGYRTHRQTDKQADADCCMGEWMHRRTDRHTHENSRVDRQMGAWTDRQTDRWKNTKTDRQNDWKIESQKDKQRDRQTMSNQVFFSVNLDWLYSLAWPEHLT